MSAPARRNVIALAIVGGILVAVCLHAALASSSDHTPEPIRAIPVQKRHDPIPQMKSEIDTIQRSLDRINGKIDQR